MSHIALHHRLPTTTYRAYVKSVEAQFDKDEAGRRDAAARAFGRANNDSSASVLTRTIIEQRRRHEEEMYDRIYNDKDILSEQLYASEEGETRLYLFTYIYLLIYIYTYI